MANAYTYSNTAQATTLSGSISAGATTITVGATTGFPGTTPYILAVDFEQSTEELVKVTGVAGTNLTVERGFGGTSAQSHSLGAVVRHVYNAQDATDFRTHEAATGAVHGLTGDIVGTSDTQTLSNKTLTSPTINSGTLASGALSGTFTGAPTASGAIAFTGAPVFSGGPNFNRAATTDMSLGALVTGDTFDRFRILADGKHEWGPGNGARDVTLYRDSANVLASDDTIRSYGAAAGTDAFQTRVAGDTNSRLNVDADGGLSWGPGNATQDTSLYRDSANVLKTDDSLVVTGTISASNISTGAWTAWSPSWLAEGGASPTLGNGTLDAAYHKVGRKVEFRIQLVWGSTTAAGGGGGSENWTFTLPFQVAATHSGWRTITASAKDSSISTYYLGLCELDTTNSGQVRRIVAGDSGGTAFWDSVAPFTWATGDTLWVYGAYESST